MQSTGKKAQNRKELTMRIYVASYAGYNDGILDGRWHELPSATLWEDIKESCVEGAEEFGIFDYEADFHISEYDNIDELNEIAEQLDTLTEEEEEIITVLMEDGYSFEEAMDKKDDCIYHCYDNMADIAYYYYIECGLVSEDTPLVNYVDWDAVGRDMSFDGTFLDTPSGNIVEVIH